MKKKLLSLLCVVLLVVGAVVGTFAYLTSQDSVVNTFTVGKVEIDLHEAKVDEYGNPLKVVKVEGQEDTFEKVADVKDATRIHDTNLYKLIPGHTYVKDPTVTVLADSENSYIRMIVTVERFAKLKEAIPEDKYPAFYQGGVFLLEKLCVDKEGNCTWDNSKWVFVPNAKDNADGIYEFRYKDVVNTLSDTNGDKEPDARTLEALFTEITVPSFLEKTGLQSMANVNIKVVAHAIQADGFADADAAWAKF